MKHHIASHECPCGIHKANCIYHSWMLYPTHPCRVEGCTQNSNHYAKGNDAIFGHVCDMHYRRLPDSEQVFYGHISEMLKSRHN